MKVNRLCCKIAVIGIVSAVPSAVLAWDSMITGDALDGYVQLNASDNGSETAFTQPSHWKPEGVPESRFDYIVQGERTIRTPNSGQANFAGHSLTIDNGRLYLKTTDVTINDLRLYGGAIVAANGGTTFELKGALSVFGKDDTNDKSCMDVSANSGSRRINVVGDLAGAADARLRIRATSNDSPANGYGRVHIAPEGGANADWEGRFYVIGDGVDQAQKIVLSASSFAALGSRGANETAGGDDLITLDNDGHFSADGGFNFSAAKIKIITCGAIATDGAIGQDGYSLRFGDGARIVGNNAYAILRVRDINGGVILFDDVSLSSLTLKVEGDNVRFGSGYNNPDVPIEINGSIVVESGAVLGPISGSGTSVEASTGKVTLYGEGRPLRAGERILKKAVGWYDASDASTIAFDGDTDHVIAWANKAAGGGAYDLAKSGNVAAFLADQSSKYGKTAVAFTNSWSLVSESSLAWSTNQSRTIVSVGYMDTVGYNEANPTHESWDKTHFFPLCISNGDQSGSFGLAHRMGDNSGYWDTAGKQDGDGNPVGNFVEVSDTFAMPDDAWATQCMWSDGAKVGGFKTTADGATTALVETSLVGTLGTPSNAKIMIGQYMRWGWKGYGAVAEAAVFDWALSAEELSELNGYFNRKWFGQTGIPYSTDIPALELTDGSSLDITDTAATIGTLSGMGTVNGSNAMLTVGEFAPVCGDITVNAPVAEPAEGEYVTLRITINPADGNCGTLVVPAGYDLSKVDLVVTGCEHLTSADTFTVFQGKVGEALSRFHSVSSDSDCGLSLKYDSASGKVSGSLKKGMMIIIR